MSGRCLFENQIEIIEELLELEQARCVNEDQATDQERRLEQVTRLFGERPNERRKFFRIPTDQRAQLNLDGESREVQVTSLGAGGMFIRTDLDSQTSGQRLDLSLELEVPRSPRLDCQVEVCWIADPDIDHLNGMGVKFIDLSPQNRSLLVEHLRNCLLTTLDLAEKKCSFFFEHSGDVTLLLDEDQIIQKINDCGKELLDLEQSQIGQISIEQLMAPGLEQELSHALAQVRSGEQSKIPCYLRSAAGRAIPVEMKLSPFTPDGLQLGVLLVAHDLRQGQPVLQHAAEHRLYQADKQSTISQITSSLAHDLNTPLAFMHSNLTMLHDYLGPLQKVVRFARDQESPLLDAGLLADLEADLGDLVCDTLEGSRRLRDTVSELLSFSQMGNTVRIRLDVNKALDSSLRMFWNQVRHRTRLEKKYSEHLPTTYCNFGQLSLVFLNLLTNACYAFDQVDIERNVVTIATRQVGDMVQISFSDNGRGMTAEELELVFEPFFSTRQKQGALGLGLTIARENMAQMGGSLKLKSRVGEGTTAIVELPIKKSTRPKVVTPNRVIGVPSANREVLVIDDEPYQLQILQRMLRRHCKVTTTTSPAQALKMIAGQPYDVVVCDVVIPEMNGLTFLETLEERNPALARRVVFITGGSFTQQEEDRLDEICNQVLRKPVEFNTLLDVIAKAAAS